VPRVESHVWALTTDATRGLSAADAWTSRLGRLMQILRETTRRTSPTCRLDRPEFLPTRLLRAYAEQPPLVFSDPAPPLIFAACMAPPSAPVEAQFFPRDTSDFTDLSPRQTRILRARTRGGVGFGYATQRDCYALTLTTGRGFYSRQPL